MPFRIRKISTGAYLTKVGQSTVSRCDAWFATGRDDYGNIQALEFDSFDKAVAALDTACLCTPCEIAYQAGLFRD